MKILIIGMVNSSNLGDQVIYECLRRLFEKNHHDINACDFNGNGKERQVSEVNESESLKKIIKIWLEKNRYLSGFIKNVSWHFEKRKFYNALTQKIRMADSIVIGGGQLITDINFGLPRRFSEIHRACIVNKKPYSTIFCGAGETFSKKGSEIYKKLFEGADHIVLRGLASSLSVRKMAVDNKYICTCPDPVFICKELIKARSVNKINTLGICYQDINSLSLHSDHLRKIGVKGVENIISEIIDQHLARGYKVEIFTNGEIADFISANNFYKSKYVDEVNVAIVDRPTDPMSLINLISSYSRVISFRMHAAIIAYSYGVPTLNLVWDKKIQEVWDRFGALEVVIDLEKGDTKKHWPEVVDDISIDQALIENASKEIRKLISLI